MSQLGTLVQHFTESADLARALNTAIVTLKRVAYPITPDEPKPSPDTVRELRDRLASIISALLPHLDDGTAAEEPAIIIPASVVAQVRATKQHTLAYFRADLAETRDRLLGEQPLSDDDFRLLDTLLSLVDADTAAIFRRMVRR